MPVCLWTTLVFGGTLLLALAGWLIYFRFFLAPDSLGHGPSPAPAASADMRSPAAAAHADATRSVAAASGAEPSPDPQHAHRNWADTAARDAVAAAARAQSATLNMFGMKPPAANAVDVPVVSAAPEAPETPAAPETPVVPETPSTTTADTPAEATPDA